jgi:glycosyltransferase involved in cell wall biosynthesis
MLKVCYIITKLELGGAQKVALYTAQHLDKKQFQDFLITGSGGILDNEALSKFRLFQLPSLVREVSPFKDLKALWQIYKILKKEKPDIVHTHSSKAGILGRFAAKLAGIKKIVHTVHGYGFNETQKWYVKYIYVYVEKICAMISDKLIAVSKEDIKKGIAYRIAKESKFTLIRAGIDISFYKNYTPNAEFKKILGIDDKTRIISTIGPFKPQKNLKDFISAAEIVLSSISDVVFIIAGDGQLRPELEKQIASFGLQKKILLLGWRTDIADILYASEAFVMTSLWEGLPCTIVEAMCCAKPVIANGIDGVKEVIINGENGWQTKPYDYQDTAAKIIKLLQDKTLLLQIAQKAKASINEEFDSQYMVKQQENLYKELLQSVLS